jgi:hypothetical protein
MNFKSFLKDKKDYNAVYIVINQLNKYAYLILCYKITIAKNITQFFIINVYHTHESLKIIVLNHNL